MSLWFFPEVLLTRGGKLVVDKVVGLKGSTAAQAGYVRVAPVLQLHQVRKPGQNILQNAVSA